MGAYSPAPVVTPAMHARIMREIILPAVNGMAADGIPYTGFLYAGVMIDAAGNPKVLEFNCRLGDPETQPIMMRLKSRSGRSRSSTRSTARSTGSTPNGTGAPRSASCSPPPAIRTTRAGATSSPASTQTQRRRARCSTPAPSVADGKVVTSGGRVLCVTALGDSVRQAQRSAYAAVAAHPLRRHAVPHRHRPSRARARRG